MKRKISWLVFVVLYIAVFVVTMVYAEGGLQEQKQKVAPFVVEGIIKEVKYLGVVRRGDCFGTQGTTAIYFENGAVVFLNLLVTNIPGGKVRLYVHPSFYDKYRFEKVSDR